MIRPLKAYAWKARQWWYRRQEIRLADARRVVIAAYDLATKTPSKVISHEKRSLSEALHQRLAGEIGKEWAR